METNTMTAYRIPDDALLLRFASIYLSTSANLERAVWCVGPDVMCSLGVRFPEASPVITDPLRVFDIPVLPALRLTKDEIRLMVPASTEAYDPTFTRCELWGCFTVILLKKTDPLRFYFIHVWTDALLANDEVLLMVPTGTEAEGASRRRFNPLEPSTKPMQTGFNVPAPVAEAASDVDVPYLPSQLAKSLDLAPDTPAPIVADALEEAGRDFEAEVVRRIDRAVVTYGGRDRTPLL